MEERKPDLSWIDKLPEKRRAGTLLAAYRIRFGIPQMALSRAIGVPEGRVNIWENSKSPIDASYLGAINKRLELSLLEAQRLLYARLPALNPEWLAPQPEYLKAGMLLQAYRELKGFSGRELAQELCRLATTETSKAHLGTTLIHNWEKGNQSIAPKWHPSLVIALALEEEQASDFLRQIRLSAPGITENSSIKWMTHREKHSDKIKTERENPPTREK